MENNKKNITLHAKTTHQMYLNYTKFQFDKDLKNPATEKRINTLSRNWKRWQQKQQLQPA